MLERKTDFHRSEWSAATLAVVACTILTGLPDLARGDWNVGTDAEWRHDNNVGNAGYSDDIVGDFILAAKISVSRLFPLDGGFSLTAGADLSGERYDRLDGLNNASLGAALGLRKKWGLGAYAPWIRIGGSVARTDYDADYRNASIYRAALGAGRRLNERWNLALDYTFERRSAASSPQEAPGVSGDAFSQTSETLNAHAQFACSENTYLTAGLIFRHGDVVSTTLGSLATYTSLRAYADDLAFGPDAYAYRQMGTTVGFRVGVNYAPAPHHLLGIGFQRLDTHTEGGNAYTKSIPELRWDYSF
jgi:hypothetical protein